ncbi:MAG: hypothetical protein IKQ69_07900 [Oscillospiraceae bacterium]|nr:hypothetical protein [Oscillospiraceae bacterium]
MGDLFDSVKGAVKISDAAKAYGYTPNRAGFICCPFHSERTPSLKLYDKTFHCYGCGAHGSAIDFAAMLFNLAPLDAAKKLNDDFDLHLTDEPPSREEQDQRRHVRDVRQMFDAWREQMLNQIDTVIRVANLADYENLTDAEALAIRYREAFGNLADILANAPLSEQMAVFRDRKEVERLCRVILSNMPGRSRTA